LSQQEIFILCRSQDRAKKDAAIVGRAEMKIENWSHDSFSMVDWGTGIYGSANMKLEPF
jgi:hypothetical protein